MNSFLQSLKYVFSDWLSATLAWVLFFFFRKIFIEPLKFGHSVEIEFTTRFYYAIVIIPLFWLLLYFITGFYNTPFRRSRLKELSQTLMQSFVGTLILFFTVLLDDQIGEYRHYYLLVLGLFGIHFFITYFPRLLISTRTIKRIHNRKIGFRTLMVGCSKNAVKLYLELENQVISSGFFFEGFIRLDPNIACRLKTYLPELGNLEDMVRIIEEKKIQEVILAIESAEHDRIEAINNALRKTKVRVKVIPDMHDILTGQVKMNAIFGSPLVEINHDILPLWQRVLKRVFDLLVASGVLLVFSWLYLLLMLLVKFSSTGPVFYRHQRIGKNGKPFQIIKFRTMVENAEKGTPKLSSENDPRITKLGKFLRRTRLDELPQFYNVILGEMSIVGPRPERQYFIDLIMKKAPHYEHLHRVRPGITSWGQVKFGYAENVDQMVKRLKYDILYIENMSLLVDLKILIYTVLIVLQGRGK